MAYTSSFTGALIDTILSNSTLSTIINLIYPIGSIYISINNIDPTTLFGGTWERILDTFLLAAGSTYTVGSTGGSATMAHTHTLAHTHTIAHTHTLAHTHTIAHTHTYSHTHTTPATNTGDCTLTTNLIPAHTHGSLLSNTTINLHGFGGGGNFIHTVSGSATGSENNSNGFRSATQLTKQTGAGSYSGVTLNLAHTHTSVGGGGAHNHSLVAVTTNSQSTTTTSAASATNSGAASTTTTSAASATNSGAASAETTSAASNANNMPPYLAVCMWKRTA